MICLANGIFSQIKFVFHFAGFLFLCICGPVGYWMLNDCEANAHSSFILFLLGTSGFIAYIVVRAISFLMDPDNTKTQNCLNKIPFCKACVTNENVFCLCQANLENETQDAKSKVHVNGVFFVVIQGWATLPGFIACILFFFQCGGSL